MPETFIWMAPPISTYFSKNLLSTPFFKFNADYLKSIADWLLHKIEKKGFRRLPGTVNKLKQQYREILELYEWAKTKERENEKNKNHKTRFPFYRPGCNKRDVSGVFERLESRFSISRKHRENNGI